VTRDRSVEVGSGPKDPWRLWALAVGGLILAAGAVWLWVGQPREAIWGNSPIIPRVIAATGFPAALYMTAWALVSLLRRDPLLRLDSDGITTRTQPPRPRRVRWVDVAAVKATDDSTVVISRSNGRSVRIFTESLEEGWNAERVVAAVEEFRRKHSVQRENSADGQAPDR